MTALTPAPLPANFVNYAVSAEKDGSLLIGTELDGLRRLIAKRMTKVFTGNQIEDIHPYRAPDEKTWLAGTSKLGYLEGGHYTSAPLPVEMRPLRGRGAQAITTDRNGDVWLQEGSRIGMFRLHDGQWSKIPGTTDKDPAIVLATDGGGRVWAGYTSGIVTIFDGANRTDLDRNKGLTVGGVSALYPSAEGIWIGGQDGLNVVIDGHLVELKFAGDIRIEGISGIMRTENGTMWLNALPGVLRISRSEVDQALHGASHAMHYRLFTRLDGLTGTPPQLRPLPSIIRGTGDTIWFTTTNGVFSIHADHINTNTLAPTIAIRGLLVDGRQLETNASVVLSKGAKDLRIDYTALSLSIPERVRFRYKLEGYDKEWKEADTRRQAFYTHLPPGHFVFHVIACNNDGVWNNAGATLPLDLPPTFLQSWYFKLFCFTLSAVALWWLYHLRISQAEEKIQTRLYERLAERERIARDLHDTFFQGIQGLLLSFNVGTKRLAEGDPVRALLENTLLVSDEVMLEGRKLVLDLRTRSSEAAELSTDLGAAAAEFAMIYPARFELTVIGKARGLDTVVAEELYRVGREALYNAFRHARATSIEVQLTYGSREMKLNLRDDGVGISVEVMRHGALEGHFGLPGMAERAKKIGARLSIFTREGGGTEIEVKLSSRLAYRSGRLRT
ncbi:MAG: histidine kinase [Acidobacteriota bacterium]|nr:histidine kinase [Acidobacteriota bacterium]